MRGEKERHARPFLVSTRHSRYVTLLMAEVAVPRALFREILQQIA
jgi:hypothetical protein